MFWNKKVQEKRDDLSFGDFVNLNWGNNYINGTIADTEMQESTYYKCIQRISADVAKIPLQLKQSTDNGEILAKQHPLYKLIQRPNPFMSQIDFLKAMVAVQQHKGESGALIQRDVNGNPIALYPVNITRFVIDDVGLAKSTMQNPILVYYQCGLNGAEYTCFYRDILHFKGTTLDGLTSINIKDNLKDTIATNQASQAYQKELFSNGMTNKAIVQLTSDIKDPKELAKTQAKFESMYTSSNRIFTVPAGYNVSPLELKLSDSQFAELKKMGQIDICTSFGLQPYQIGIMDGYNNNSLEQSNLNYLSNVLQIIFETIEAESNYKLLSNIDLQQNYYFTFDEKQLLRMDSKTQSEVYTSYVQNSIYTPNEVRLKLGEIKAEDGDDLIANSGVLKLKDLYKTASNNANSRGGDNIG